MIRLGVAGWPVAHSLSPAMQNAALAAVGLAESWRYQLLPISPGLFEETVPGLAGSGFRGINVTIPHKQAALALATGASARARAMGSANTLVFDGEGGITADNSDGPGMAAALAALLEGGVQGRSAAVLGAGGTARAAVWALRDAGAGSVKVWNRTAARAVEVCAEVGGEPVVGEASGPGRPEAESVAGALAGTEIIVNCTSVGLHDGDGLEQLPVSDALLRGAAAIVDFVYRPDGTPLGDAAERLGIPLVDGFELLVRQGAESFTQFTGLPAPVDAMRAAIRG